jgi:histone H3/H4
MADQPSAVVVRGLTDLQRAFSRVSRDLGSGVREALEAAGEPVRSEASQLALQEISGMRRSRLPWWQMRVGVTRKVVYVAPVRRGMKSSGRERFRRPKLAPRLLDEAMIPALEHNRARLEGEILETLDDLFRMWERI